MAEGQEAVDFDQSYCKKSRVRPLDPSHRGQSPKAVAMQNAHFFKKAKDSRRQYGSDRKGNPNYGREAVVFLYFFIFPIKKSIIDKILVVRLEGLFWTRN